MIRVLCFVLALASSICAGTMTMSSYALKANTARHQRIAMRPASVIGQTDEV